MSPFDVIFFVLDDFNSKGTSPMHTNDPFLSWNGVQVSSVSIWCTNCLLVVLLCRLHLYLFSRPSKEKSMFSFLCVFCCYTPTRLRSHKCEVCLLTGPFLIVLMNSSRWLLGALNAWIFTCCNLYSLDGAVKQSTPWTPVCHTGLLKSSSINTCRSTGSCGAQDVLLSSQILKPWSCFFEKKKAAHKKVTRYWCILGQPGKECRKSSRLWLKGLE